LTSDLSYSKLITDDERRVLSNGGIDMEQLKYRVYKAMLSDGREEIKFCVSSVREVSLRQQIKRGELMIDEDSMQLIHETTSRNEARAMAVEI
jgi:hypothetical protein